MVDAVGLVELLFIEILLIPSLPAQSLHLLTHTDTAAECKNSTPFPDVLFAALWTSIIPLCFNIQVQFHISFLHVLSL